MIPIPIPVPIGTPFGYIGDKAFVLFVTFLGFVMGLMLGIIVDLFMQPTVINWQIWIIFGVIVSCITSMIALKEITKTVDQTNCKEGLI